MKLLSNSTVLLLAVSFAGAAAAAARVFERATGPFLTQLNNQTWILGNEIWNMTQQVTYGVKLYYQDQDCVNNAVGHYVSYSKSLRQLPSSLECHEAVMSSILRPEAGGVDQIL